MMAGGENYKFLGVKLRSGEIISPEQLEKISPRVKEFAQAADRLDKSDPRIATTLPGGPEDPVKYKDGYATIEEMEEQIKYSQKEVERSAKEAASCYKTAVVNDRLSLAAADKSCSQYMRGSMLLFTDDIEAYRDFRNFLSDRSGAQPKPAK